ncbi:MAG: SAM-dependent methyltransferase [Candidatus Obscuribacterales bacterium]|nr:SAM-dependent methyltransferase [Steroidobacteraceae bacterium]
MNVPLDLPPLTSDESVHSQLLVDRIRDEIERCGGWLSFERFMEMALYEPGLGYYSAGARKLGASGDFVTAPEISPLFSRCLARQCAQVLAELNGGDILELGAGSGAMAADILLELAALKRLPNRYLILEVSADLRERQQNTLQARVPELLSRVTWLDALPDQLVGLVLANEVLDALPVQRFVIRGDQVNASGVTWQLGKLDWSEIRADPDLTAAVRSIEEYVGRALPDGYSSEINLRLNPWFGGIARALQRGVMLFIDYGLPRGQYYGVERNTGTLLCHFRHRFHDDALLNVGIQDIGAWVDFTAVASVAVDRGCDVLGYNTQAHFLIGCGIETLLADLAHRGLESRLQVGKQAMVLILPGEMGERFKVIALGKKWQQALIGFSVRDMAAAL